MEKGKIEFENESEKFIESQINSDNSKVNLNLLEENERLKATLAEYEKIAKIIPVLEGLFNFVAETADLGIPMMTKICVVQPEKSDEPWVHLWAAVNEQTPLDRIDELVNDNERLKAEIEQLKEGK